MDSVMCLGTNNGVVTLRSSDGNAWEMAHSGLKGWAVPKLTFVPGSPNKVLAGTRGDGVWLSEDFGKTWRKPSYGKRGPGKVRCVAVDPNNPNRVYAGCEPIDVFVSNDLAQTWERLDAIWDIPFVATVPYPVAVVEPHVRDIAIDPSDSNTIYIALQVGYILKTTDAGKSWTLLNNNFDCDVHTIVIDPVHTNNVFIATGGHDARQGKVNGRALYASQDGGDTWAPTAMNFSQEYSVPLTMHPNRPEVMYSALAHGQPTQWKRPTGAESTIIRTADGGRNWEPVSNGLSEAASDFPEAILFDREHPDRLYAALRRGDIYASTDGGNVWSDLDVRVPGIADVKLVNA